MRMSKSPYFLWKTKKIVVIVVILKKNILKHVPYVFLCSIFKLSYDLGIDPGVTVLAV